MVAKQGSGTARTRPRNRRRLIVDAATELFAAHGSQDVTFADVAAAVGVTPSAMYRHFRNKAELLEVAIGESSALFRDAAPGGSRQLVDAAYGNRARAILYLRDAGYLSDAGDEDPSNTLDAWGAALRTQRPELTPTAASFLVDAALGALSGTIGHGTATPTAATRTLITDVMEGVTGANLPTVPSATRTPSHPLEIGRFRREATLDAAVRLFRQHGYSAVGVDDIGAAAGITGSGVYRHFRNKVDVLVAAFRRTGERLTSDAARAVASATDAAAAIDGLVTSYAEVAASDPDLLFVYVHEARNLPADVRREMSSLQNRLLAIWVRALTTVQPGLAEQNARIVALSVIGGLNAAATTSWAPEAEARTEWLVAVARGALAAVLPR